jgi:hypothetical protein
MRLRIAMLLAIMACGCAARPGAPPTSRLTEAQAQPPAQSAPPAQPAPSQPALEAAAAIQPILYHRSGGIAGTDDRVVIWPDGLVEVDGKVMVASRSRLSPQRLKHLAALFRGFDQLHDQYLGVAIPDTYRITIHYGAKTVESFDLAPGLPRQFRALFSEIESIAAESASAQLKPAEAP